MGSLKSIATALITVVFWAKTAWTYEVPTHVLLTEQGVLRSALSDANLLLEIGVSPADQFVGSDQARRTLIDTVSFGAVREDDGLWSVNEIKRFCNHFFDPQFSNFTGRGLDDHGDRGVASPDWALEDRFEVATLANAGCLGAPADRPQTFSYRHALQQYYLAMTLSAPGDRSARLGSMFEMLGHVVHHIQDMAQPQHTRNERHPGSFYERYTRDHVDRAMLERLLQQYPLPVPAMPTIRHFWHTPGATTPRFTGMAEFSAQNYVTPERMFAVRRNASGVAVISAGNLAFPLPNGVNRDGTSMRVASYTYDQPQRDGSVRRETADVVFGDVYDEYPGAAAATWSDMRLASYSLLSLPLTRIGLPGTAVLTTTPLVFEDNYRVLLPRAVAYTAGIIDHFVRGRLSLQRSGSGSNWSIENVSRSGLGMSGTFTIFSENGSGVRTAIPGATFVRNLAAGQATTVSFPEPASTTARLIVVFIGQIGNEVPADDDFRSVAARVIDYSPPPIPCGSSLSRVGGIEGLDLPWEMGSTAGSVQLRFEAYSIPDSLVVTATNSAATRLATTNGMVSGLHTRTFDFNPTALGTTRARVRITGSEEGTVWNLAMSCPGKSLSSSDFPPTRSVRFDFGSAASGAAGSCQASFYVDGRYIGRAYVSANGGTSLTTQLTAGPGHGAEFRNFSCTADNRNLFVGAQYTDPGGTVRLQNMNQTGVRLFDVR